MTMKFYLRLLGPLIFTFIILFYVDVYKLLKIILVLDWRYFILSLILVPFLIMIRSYRWKKILALYNISYSLWQCFKIYFVEMLAVMVVAAVGTFVKVFYLKREGYGLLQSALTILADKYFDYLLPLVFGIISLLLAWLKPAPYLGLFIFFAATFASFVPLRQAIELWPSKFIIKQLDKLIKNKLTNLHDYLLPTRNALNFETYLYSVASFGIYFVCIYLVNESLHIGLNLFQIVIIMTLTSLIAFVPISFLGIGTRDAGLLVVFKWFGYLPEQAVALSLALLLFRIIIVLMGSIFWLIDPLPLHELRRFEKE